VGDSEKGQRVNPIHNRINAVLQPHQPRINQPHQRRFTIVDKITFAA